MAGDATNSWTSSVESAIRTLRDIAHMAETDTVGPLTLRGFSQPVAAFRLKSIRD